MNQFESNTKPLKWYMALPLAALAAGCGGSLDPVLGEGGRTTGISVSPVNLGAAATYGIAATAGVANTLTAPNTTINGDVVLAPTLTCNTVAVPGGAGTAGFGACGGSPPTLSGTVTITGATATAVKAAMNTAFLSITPPSGPPAAGSLGGATNIPAGTSLGEPTGAALVQGDNLFVPGVYRSLTSILITGDLTLDGQGNPNAAFIFQSSTTVGLAAGTAPPSPHSRIILVNGARASNVFWQASSAATLGAYSEFQGNILAATSITMETGATSCGRLFAGAWSGGSGAFVFDSNIVSVPGQPFSPPVGYSTTCQ
jgi:Ice-binding-like